MYDMILVRYGEMTLKKKNYKKFLFQINQHIKNKCNKFKNLKFFNTDYRFYIYLNGESSDDVLQELQTIPGLHSFSLCKKVKVKTNDTIIESIAEESIQLIKDERPNKNFSFKVSTNRGDKSFPMTSIEISQNVAKLVLPNIEGMSVDVHNPDLTLNIDFRSEGIYIYVNAIKGLGGYPSGIAGKGLVMMSGGIDSPVAAFLTMKKGVKISAIHYASPPYTSDMALQKVFDLLEQLSIYQMPSEIELYVVPFTDIQMRIYEKADPIYLVTLMRRAMYRIAAQIVKRDGFECIINGESIGQVASQTLESMKVVNDVTNIPIIRPLATYDKDEIVSVAQKINTFAISIKPYEDCCTVFVPEHPVIKPNLEYILKEEEKCNLDILISNAISDVKKYNISKNNNINVFANSDKFDI